MSPSYELEPVVLILPSGSGSTEHEIVLAVLLDLTLAYLDSYSLVGMSYVVNIYQWEGIVEGLIDSRLASSWWSCEEGACGLLSHVYSVAQKLCLL